jgi:ribosomal protein S18 acetylase RimI-like enzyme
MTIREAQRTDIAVIADFQIKMAKETENLDLNPETVKKGVTAVFSHPNLGKYFVAESESGVCASLMVTPEWSDWRNSQVLWIQSVYVLSEFRKKGIFKKMYQHLKTMVEGSELYSGLRLYVDKSNHNARNVYRQIGMNGEHYEVFEWMKDNS